MNGIIMGIFWKQSAGIVHDSGHIISTYKKRLDYWFAWLAGNVLFGANGSWWIY